jgi:hypothetical protein
MLEHYRIWCNYMTGATDIYRTIQDDLTVDPLCVPGVHT